MNAIIYQEPVSNEKIYSRKNYNNDKKIDNIKVSSNKKLLVLLSIFIILIVIIIITIISILIIRNNKKNNGDKDNDDQNSENSFIKEEKKSIFPLNDKKLSEVMNIYNSIGDNDKNTLEVFKKFLSENTLNLEDDQKVYLAYYWITSNIEYDYDGYYGRSIIETNPTTFFQKRKTVCTGYSNLFRELLYSMNKTDVVCISGYSKGLGYSPLKNAEINHDWNAVKINGEWCLVDTTWGIPSDTYYLCTPPQCFVRDHLPSETQSYFQLLENPISVKTFNEFARSKSFCCEKNCKIIEDKAIQNKCEGTISLRYKSESKIYPYISYGYSNTQIPQTFIKKYKDGYDVYYHCNETKLYSLSLSGREEDTPFYSFSYIYINCTEPSTKPFNYPELEIYYYLTDFELISPMMQNLTRGQKYNFEAKLYDYDELFIKIDDEVISMKKKGTTFRIENVYIHGNNKVFLFTKEYTDNSSYYINKYVIYNTIGNEVEFPQAISNKLCPKLIAPFKNSLIKGQTYEFIIETDKIVSFYVSYCSFVTFEKKGDIYSINFQIQQTCSNTVLKILYKNSETGGYYTLYQYNIE